MFTFFLYACHGRVWKQLRCLRLSLIGGLRGSTAAGALVSTVFVHKLPKTRGFCYFHEECTLSHRICCGNVGLVFCLMASWWQFWCFNDLNMDNSINMTPRTASFDLVFLSFEQKLFGWLSGEQGFDFRIGIPSQKLETLNNTDQRGGGVRIVYGTLPPSHFVDTAGWHDKMAPLNFGLIDLMRTATFVLLQPGHEVRGILLVWSQKKHCFRYFSEALFLACHGFKQRLFFLKLFERHSQCLVICWYLKTSRFERPSPLSAAAESPDSRQCCGLVVPVDPSYARATLKRNDQSHAGEEKC